MVPGHSGYQGLGFDAQCAEYLRYGVPCAVKDRRFNRSFAWMFHTAIYDPNSAACWLPPGSTLKADAAVDEFCARMLPDYNDDEYQFSFTRMLLATFAWAIMCILSGVAIESTLIGAQHLSTKGWPKPFYSSMLKYLKIRYNSSPEARKQATRRVHRRPNRRIGLAQYFTCQSCWSRGHIFAFRVWWYCLDY